jgi:hypothetical protein
VDPFGIDADHRGGRRRWTAWGWPLLGGLVGALLGVLAAPPLVGLLQTIIGEPPWLLPALMLAIPLATVVAFIAIGRRRRD